MFITKAAQGKELIASFSSAAVAIKFTAPLDEFCLKKIQEIIL